MPIAFPESILKYQLLSHLPFPWYQVLYILRFIFNISFMKFYSVAILLSFLEIHLSTDLYQYLYFDYTFKLFYLILICLSFYLGHFYLANHYIPMSKIPMFNILDPYCLFESSVIGYFPF